MKLLILHSGGAESTLLSERAIHDGPIPTTLLHFTWPHPAREQELESFRGCNPFFQEQVVLDIPMAGPADEQGPRVVAARNQVFLSIAINYAATHGIDTVWYGACADDNQDYADCRPEFIEQMNALAATWGVTIEAPLIQMSKAQIWAELNTYGVRSDDVWSCYTPVNDQPCGVCNSCRSNNVS
jgi:queuosine biosynthesis protein QueC